MNKVYLVDTENVCNRWMDLLLQDLQENDKVVLFYTDASSKYTLDELQDIINKAEHIQFVRCTNGHANALDFQLSAMVGYMFQNDPDAYFTILSNDLGYDSVVQIMSGMGASIERLGVGEKIGNNPPKVIEKHTVHERNQRPQHIGKRLTRDAIARSLSMHAGSDIVNWIYKTMWSIKSADFSNAKNTRAVELNNRLQRKYGVKGSVYYGKLKSSNLLSTF